MLALALGISANLNIIIYGLLHLAEDVGELLGQNGLYLQDPKGCDRIVPYRNPQCLSFSDLDTVMTTIGGPDVPETIEYASDSLDFLSGFESGEKLKEAEQPAAVRTRLLK